MEANIFHNDLFKKSYMSILPYIVSNNCRLIINTFGLKNNEFLDELIKHSELPKEAPDKNMFETMRIYWWQIDNRDDRWKEKQIIMMGGEDEFDNQFNLKTI